MKKQGVSVLVNIISFAHGLEGVTERQKYARALQDELRSAADYAADYAVETLCITGTAPLQYPVDALCSVIETLKQNIPFQNNTEITLNALPGSVTYADLRVLIEQGVNRIRFDMQSFVPSELDALGRTFSPRAMEVFMRMVQLKFVFFVYEVVVGFGLPGQTLETLRYSIEQAIKFMATNITLIPHKADGPENAAFYQEAVYTLESHGFQAYTPLHFTRPGYASRWNKLVHSNQPRLGFGVGAVSKIDGMISQVTADVQKYLAAGSDPSELFVKLEPITQSSLVSTALVERLFNLEGFDFTALNSELREQTTSLCESGLLQINQDLVTLTDAGKAAWHTVARVLLG